MEAKELSTKKIDPGIGRLCSHYAKFTRRADGGPPPAWPVFILEEEWYLFKYFFKDLYKAIERLRSKISDEEIAKLFTNSSRIAQYIFLLTGFRFSDLAVEKKIELVRNLLKYISYYRKKDIFCSNGKNIIWDKRKVRNAIRNARIFGATRGLGKTLGRINNALWMYTQFITLMHHGLNHEFHGPYPLKNREFLLVRNYYDLRPIPVWPFTSELKFNKLTNLEIYKDIKIEIEFFGHLEHLESLPPHLQSFSILVDDEPIESPSDIKNILGSCKVICDKANDFTKKFSKKNWIEKFVKIWYYYLKPLKDILGEKWEPSREQLLFLEKKPAKEFYEFLEKVGPLYGDFSEQGFRGLKKLMLEGIYS